jgi:hypothetical protein
MVNTRSHGKYDKTTVINIAQIHVYILYTCTHTRILYSQYSIHNIKYSAIILRSLTLLTEFLHTETGSFSIVVYHSYPSLFLNLDVLYTNNHGLNNACHKMRLQTVGRTFLMTVTTETSINYWPCHFFGLTFPTASRICVTKITLWQHFGLVLIIPPPTYCLFLWVGTFDRRT